MGKNNERVSVHESKGTHLSEGTHLWKVFDCFFHKKIITPFLALALAAFCIAGTSGIFLMGDGAEPKETLNELYSAAVMDAVTVEPEEIFPLVCLTAQEEQIQWQEGRVLLATINKEPQLYTAGKTLSLPGEVWTVSAKEMANWYEASKDGVTDWQIRLQQVVGVPLTSEYTHVTAMWVSPEDVIRPAYSTDITDEAMPVALPENTAGDYREWFEGNVMWSYFDSEYPWTRLGYTYDWAENSGEYGLTEFLVREGAEVTIAYTDAIPDYIKRLE